MSAGVAHRKGKTVACSVLLLDDTVDVFHVPVSCCLFIFSVTPMIIIITNTGVSYYDFRPTNLATFTLSQVETAVFVICSVQNRTRDLESEVLKCLNSAKTIIPESFMVLLSLVVEMFHLKNHTLIIWTKSRAENGVR